jgi:hypothetical protein
VDNVERRLGRKLVRNLGSGAQRESFSWHGPARDVNPSLPSVVSGQ